jgi:hypothetical protein
MPREKAKPGISNVLDKEHVESRYERKGKELQSNVLTHQDETVRNARKGTYTQGGQRISAASNAGWNSATNYAKPANNVTKLDAYQKRQEQLGSNVLE